MNAHPFSLTSNTLGRRRFLGQAGGSLLGSAAVLNTLLNLRLASAVAEDQGQDDYKALVCVFLFGGNDSFNTLIPATPEEYALYVKTRGEMALSLKGPDAALPLKKSGVPGRRFAVHPSVPELRDLYEAGDLAFLANTGTLVEPVTIEQYKARSRRLPKSLFSHNDQRDQWQTALPQGRGSTGWFGRAADLMREGAGPGAASATMNISLSGNNLLQTGAGVSAYNITPGGSVSVRNALTRELFSGAGTPAPKNETQAAQRNLFESVFAQATRQSFELDEVFSKAFDAVQLKTDFPDKNPLADSLHAIARTIGARSDLGLRRQTFFVMLGGWDMHQDLLADHPARLATLSQALRAFQGAMVELGTHDKVTTFTASDFGRTLRSNGRGTDHAWGGNSMIMGGAVAGGRIYGEYPEALLLKDGLDVGSNGRMLPTTSCDEYFCEMLRWFGVAPGDMEAVLPNIGSFYDPRSAKAPLGFMG